MMPYPTSKVLSAAVKTQQSITNQLPPRNLSGRVVTLEAKAVQVTQEIFSLDARVTELEPPPG